MLIALSLTYIVEYLRYTPMLQKHYDNYFMHYRRDILPDALNYVNLSVVPQHLLKN